jgi:hypothetical protein
VTERVDLHVSGTWQDRTEDARLGSGLNIRRGRQDYQGRSDQSMCDLVLDNSSGRYSPRYPLSPWFGALGRNTPLRVVDEIVNDPLSGSASNGWGSTPEGYTWTVTGTASEYARGSGVGSMSLASVGTARMAYLASVSQPSGIVRATMRPGTLATGDAIDMALVCRIQDASNYDYGVVRFYLDGVVEAFLARSVGGVAELMEYQLTGFTYTASTAVVAELVFTGRYLGLRAYDLSDPTAVTTVVTTSSTYRTGGVGCRAILQTSNSNALPVSVTFDDFGLDDGRFAGEVPSWPTVWNVTATDVTARIQASGLLRRLNRKSSPLRSAYYRWITKGGPTFAPLGYWPCEDANGSRLAAAAIGSTKPMLMVGDVAFAATAGPDGSDQLPSIAASGTPTNALRAYPPRVTIGEGGAWTWTFWFRGSGTNAQISPFVVSSSGTLPAWRITAENTGTATVTLNVHDRSNAIVVNPSLTVDILDDRWHFIAVNATQLGADVQALLIVDLAFDGQTASGHTLGPTQVMTTPSIVTQTNITAAYAGHFVFYDENFTEEAENIEAGGGFAGEPAGTRIARLCAEEGVTLVPAGDPAVTEPMGPQRISTLTDLLQECADTDGGILADAREVLGLWYRTRMSLYNQAPRLMLDYEQGHFDEVPEPVEDDQRTRNDVTISRRSGSSARHTITDGPLSVQDPPNGVGIYEFAATVNPESDARLADYAGWAAFQGTIDEARYPNLSTHLHRNTALIPTARVVELGDVISVDNLPTAFLPPDTALGMAQGYTEFRDGIKRQMAWLTTPAVAFEIGVVENVGSQLHAAVNSSATSMQVATTGTSTLGHAPRWTVDDAQFQFDWKVGGERVTVTDITPPASPTFATGTVDHDDNASLTPGLPGSEAVGDVLLMLAAIRNSGTGTPNTPSGWTRLDVFPSGACVQLFALPVTSTPVSAPTVSFTGGAAGATTSARILRVRGMKCHSASQLVVASAAHLNASAGDIFYPKLYVPDDCDGALILYIGWKQDDWTSVAEIVDATEVFDNASTLGNDQGIVMDYLVQTTAADIPSGSFTVTGGASAISWGAVVALIDDYQTATVTRSVNGVSASHSAGDAVQLWTPAVVGL